MRPILLCVTIFVLLGLGMTSAGAASVEKRIAFVVGNESYAAGALPTAANDAGLIAQTLQAAGFEVVGARDLDAETLRQSYADFLKRLGAAGPDAVAFVYLAGYGLQYGNDNYYVPIGANVSRDLDIPIVAIRLSDLIGPLNAMNLKARFTIFDTAYKPPFKIDGAPLAGGLALLDASPGSLVAYNAAPGTVALPGKGNYGVYAQSLAAMLREGGLEPDDIFDRVRLRVNEQTKGADVPWDSTKIDAAFRFFERGKDAPPPAASAAQRAALRTTPLKELPVQQAYTAAVARDTLQSYRDFDAVYGGDPLGKRVRVLLAVRREGITWRRTIAVDTPDAYWSYLSRYPRGPHAVAARLRLQDLAAALTPPTAYQVLAYDIPPPPPDEAVYIDQPIVYFDDPSYDFPPPPPPPDYWLPPVPVEFIDLPPPPPPFGLFFLPVPAFVPLPVYYGPPPYVAYPADNYFYGGDFGGVPQDRRIDVNSIHAAIPAAAIAAAAVGGVVGARSLGVGLPGAVRQRSTLLQQRGVTTPAQLRNVQGRPGAALGDPGSRNALPASQRLPGANGSALPAANAARPTSPTPGAMTRPAVAPSAAEVRPNATQRASTPTRDTAPTAAKSVRDNRERQNQARQNPIRQNTGRQGAQVQRDAIQQRQTPIRQNRAIQQVRPQAPRPQFRAPPPQQARPAPQQFRGPPQQFRAPPQQQFRAPPQARPGGFGGGGRPPGGGGAPRPAPAAARPAPGQPFKPHP